MTLSSNKWCLVAPVKSQQFAKKEKEKEKDAMHFQKVTMQLKDAFYEKQYNLQINPFT